MTFARIVACQIGTAFAARTDRASLFTIGLRTNPLLLRGVNFELLFTAAVIYAPPLQHIFDTAACTRRSWSSSRRSRSSSGAPTNSSAGSAATARRPSKTDRLAT